MKSWQDFLDSLSTRGGNILILLFTTFGLVFAYNHMVRNGASATIVETIKTLMSGFAGALLALLSSQASRQQMQDRVEAATAPKVAVERAETINVERKAPEKSVV